MARWRLVVDVEENWTGKGTPETISAIEIVSKGGLEIEGLKVLRIKVKKLVGS